MSSFTAEGPPWIFLSHSGRQKDFATHLYHTLCQARYRAVFFDKDPKESLPVGLDYPTHIFEACRDCKMGVVVLTEDYVCSLWPMLELQHLLRGPEGRHIYPLFYNLKPADLFEHLGRWEAHWNQEGPAWQSRMQKLQEDMPSSVQINLDIASWPENLRKLPNRSGEERSFYESEYQYIQAIVGNIFAVLPPPMNYSFQLDVVGVERMQQEIHEVFQREGSMGDDGVSMIGVYGIGGSGKSTLCRMMANFYSTEFSGRSFSLEFPTPREENDTTFLERIKYVLRLLAYGKTDCISHIGQAMKCLEEVSQTKKVFFAIDNLWSDPRDDNFGYARRATHLNFVAGTKIMIASRSRKIVSRLLPENRRNNKNVVPVPSLTEAEAVQALKHRSSCASSIPEEDLKKLARACFFEKQCHPLYLKLKGGELERECHSSFDHKQWSDLISTLIKHEDSSTEQRVLRAVEKSFDALPSCLQGTFIDLVTLQSSEIYSYQTVDYCVVLPDDVYFLCFPCSLWEFVRLHYDDCTEREMLSRVLRLQNQGLLELEYQDKGSHKRLACTNSWRTPNCRVIIHDLHKRAAESRVARHADALKKSCILHRGDFSSCDGTYEKILSSKHVTTCPDRRMESTTWRALFGSRERFTSSASSVKSQATLGSMKGMKSLYGSRKRFMSSSSSGSTSESPVKVQARYLSILSDHNWLTFEKRSSKLGKPSLSLRNENRNLEALRVLSLEGCRLQEITGWRGVPNLVLLSLFGVIGLRRIEPMGCLKKLERLLLNKCGDLDIRRVVGGAEDGSGSRSLVKAGDKLPNLQEIAIVRNNKLEEGGPLSDAFPALTKLILFQCRELRTVDGSFSSLEHLHIVHCPKFTEWGISDVAGISHLAGIISLTTLISAALLMGTRSNQLEYQSPATRNFGQLAIWQKI